MAAMTSFLSVRGAATIRVRELSGACAEGRAEPDRRRKPRKDRSDAPSGDGSSGDRDRLDRVVQEEDRGAVEPRVTDNRPDALLQRVGAVAPLDPQHLEYGLLNRV